MTKVKVFIDAGHGGKDPGGTGNGLQEKALVLGIAKRVKAILDTYEGVEVRLSRSTDVFLELWQRTKLANEWVADLFLSIHTNAGGGTGFETFITNSNPKSSTVAAQNVLHAEIMKAIGGVDRGKKRAAYAVLQGSNMTAILTEAAFIDNKADAARLKSAAFLEKAAQGHANGVISLYGLKKKAVEPPAVKPVAAYTVQKGDTLSKIAAANKTTVDALVKLNKLADKNIISVGQVLKLK